MKKLITLLLAALLVLTTFSGCKKKSQDDPEIPDTPTELSETQKAFNELQRKWFVEDNEDYVTVHYNLVNPEAYGIKDLEVTWGELDTEEDDEATIKARLEELHKFKAEELTVDQQNLYAALEWYYDLMLKDLAIEQDYTFLFTPNSGLNNNLITNLTEFVLRNEQDVKDFIVLLADTDRVIDEAIKMTKEQAEKGIVQPDVVIDNVIDNCQKFVDSGSGNEISKIAAASIDALNLADGESYKSQVSKIVLEEIIPAYQRIIDMYKGLRGKATKSGLMADWGEEGKAAYELIVKSKTSCDEGVADLIEEMDNALWDALYGLFGVMDKVNDIPSYGFEDPYRILENNKTHMKGSFPDIPDVKYTVSYLDPSITSENVSAYYVLSPLDDLMQNVIKVNPSFVENDPDGICITLAHEGYPGHLFQHTYFYENHENQELRSSLDFLGYAEGWAQYVETLAYGFYDGNKNVCLYEQYNNMFSYYLYGLIDLEMHYMGWGVDDIATYLSAFINPEYVNEYAASLYESNLGDPGMFLPYSVGLYKMWSMYEETRDTLGKKFDLAAYNKVILDTGDCPFSHLYKRVQEYVAKAK